VLPRDTERVESLRVAYDREIFVRQQRGGVSRYFAELTAAFTHHPELLISPELLFTRTDNAHLRAMVPELTSAMSPLHPVPRGIPRMVNSTDLVKDLYLRYRAGASPIIGAADWVHATYFRPMGADVRQARKLAVTLYDMTPESLGKSLSSGPYRGKHELARRADLVIAISHTTAAQFAAFVPDHEHKIVVIPLGVDAAFYRADHGRPSIDFPYLLFVGSRQQYKRFDLLVAAVQSVRARGLDLGLVIAGHPMSAEEQQQVRAALPANRLRHLTPADDELAALYQSAVAFVFPSQSEGFGLPILEAFASGCPVIASDIPVFREVAGAAAHYFTPGSSESLADAITAVTSDDTISTDMRALGHDRAAQASWLSTARKTAAAYRDFA